mgnify:CR=1 FL=1
MRIALLEDDTDQAALIAAWLDAAGHACRIYANAAEFTAEVNNDGFDLLILDWMLPESSGIEVLEWVRRNIDWSIPVIFVTQKDKEEDIVLALEKGADDYIPKPVREGELGARIKALARRANLHTRTEGKRSFGPYTIDTDARTIVHRGERIELTQKEFDLTVFLFNNLGKVFARGRLLEEVWGRSPEVNTRTVDTHISRIRKKLNLTPENGWRLSAIYQYGYRLEQVEDNGPRGQPAQRPRLR